MKTKRMRRRFMAAVMCMAALFAMVVGSVMLEPVEVRADVANIEYDNENKTCTISGDVKASEIVAATDKTDNTTPFQNDGSVILKFTATATLTLNTALLVKQINESGSSYYDLTITGSGSITINNNNGSGIHAGNLIIEGGTVSATGTEYGIQCANLTVKGSTTSVIAKTSGNYAIIASQYDFQSPYGIKVPSGGKTDTAGGGKVVYNSDGTTPAKEVRISAFTPPVISDITLPEGTVNTEYTKTKISATAGDEPIEWNASGLPTGLSIDSKTGEIYGTPTESAKDKTIIITATNGGGNSEPKSMTITINSAVSLTPQNYTASAKTNQEYIGTPFTVSGGTLPIKWSITSDKTTITGLEIDNNGQIKGKPTEADTYKITATATDKNGSSDSATLTLNVTDAPITVTGISVSGPKKVNVGKEISLTATVTPENATEKGVTWTSTDPAKATVDENGKVKGVSAGSTKIKVVTKDTASTAVPVEYPIEVVAADVPVITTESLKEGTVGTTYSETLTATGPAADKQKWTIASDSPTTATKLKEDYDLELTAAGVLKGTPKKKTDASGINIRIAVANSDDETKKDDKPFVLKINEATVVEGPATTDVSGVTAVTGVENAADVLDDFIEKAKKTPVTGKTVTYTFNLEGKTKPSDSDDKAKVDESIKSAFNGLTTSQYDIIYLDIYVAREDTDNNTGTKEKKSNVPDLGTPTEIHLKVTDDVSKYRTVLIRNHTTGSDKKGVTDFTRLSSKPAKDKWKDGTYYLNNKDLYIYTRYFSTYAIGYTKVDTWKVEFDSNGGSAVEDLLVEKGKTIKAPTNPTKDGYYFEGWYTDSGLKNKWDSSKGITDNITLFANWTKDDPDEAPSGSSTTGRTNNTNTQTPGGRQLGNTPQTGDRMAILWGVIALIVVLNGVYIAMAARKGKK